MNLWRIFMPKDPNKWEMPVDQGISFWEKEKKKNPAIVQ